MADRFRKKSGSARLWAVPESPDANLIEVQTVRMIIFCKMALSPSNRANVGLRRSSNGPFRSSYFSERAPLESPLRLRTPHTTSMSASNAASTFAAPRSSRSVSSSGCPTRIPGRADPRHQGA